MNKFAVAAARLLFLFLVFFSNPALADHVRRDYNHNVSFSYIRTYSFGEVKMTEAGFGDLARKAITSELSAKGLNLVSTGGEVTIFVHDDIRNEKDLEDTYSDIGDWGSGWSWAGWKLGVGGSFREGLFSSRAPRFGRVIVDVFSTPSRKLLWRGTARIDRTQSVSKQEDHLDRDITSMLTKFPPKQ